MEEARRWIGASCHVLLESTGDSEAQCSEGALAPGSETLQAADDDAQSCSYGLTPGTGIVEVYEDVEAGDGIVDGDDGHDGGECSEEEDGVVEQCRRDRGEEVVKSGSPTASEDSDSKAVNEKERDKLFWEACLAPESDNGDGLHI